VRDQVRENSAIERARMIRNPTVLGLARRCIADGFASSSARPILADALEEVGYDDAKYLHALRYGDVPWFRGCDPTKTNVAHESIFEEAVKGVPPELEGYDWKEAFGYAGEPEAHGSGVPTEAVPGSGIATTPFSRVDVAEVLATAEGENDGPNWLCVGKLKDGRWFALDAGCDYTGWD